MGNQGDAFTSADDKFFLRFSALAFCYHHYRADRKKTTANYDDCYFKCDNAEKKWDEKRRTYCDECPHTAAKERFFETAQATFDERFNEQLGRGKFEELLNLVRQVSGFEGSEDDLSTKSAYLLTLYLEEKSKWERQEEANKPSG